MFLKAALKVHNDLISDNCRDFPMQEKNRALLHSMLPLHVKECGKIVEIETLFEITIKEK